jgi:hypothetical protein
VEKDTGTYRVTTLDVIWHIYQEKVYDELKDILNVSEVDTSTQGFFEQRTAAAKRVYQKMSQKDQDWVQGEVQIWKTRSLPQAVQRQ